MTDKREKKRAAEARVADLFVDPRRGDIEDDASSTKRRSMLSLFGSMLVEISLPKLLVAWTLLLVVPGLLLGLAPIVFVEWLTVVTDKLASLVIGLWSLLILAILIALGWFGWRALFRTAEKNFWALNSSWSSRAMPPSAKPSGKWPSGYSPATPATPSRAKLRAGLGCRRRDSGLRPGPARALARLAAYASLRQPVGDRILEKGRRGGARQQRRRDHRLSGGGRAGLGLRRCRHGATAQPRQIRQGAEARPDLAHRPSVRHSRRRRALR